MRSQMSGSGFVFEFRSTRKISGAFWVTERSCCKTKFFVRNNFFQFVACTCATEWWMFAIATAVTRIRTEVAAATTQSTNHDTITAPWTAWGKTACQRIHILQHSPATKRQRFASWPPFRRQIVYTSKQLIFLSHTGGFLTFSHIHFIVSFFKNGIMRHVHSEDFFRMTRNRFWITHLLSRDLFLSFSELLDFKRQVQIGAQSVFLTFLLAANHLWTSASEFETTHILQIYPKYSLSSPISAALSRWWKFESKIHCFGEHVSRSNSSVFLSTDVRRSATLLWHFRLLPPFSCPALLCFQEYFVLAIACRRFQNYGYDSKERDVSQFQCRDIHRSERACSPQNTTVLVRVWDYAMLMESDGTMEEAKSRLLVIVQVVGDGNGIIPEKRCVWTPDQQRHVGKSLYVTDAAFYRQNNCCALRINSSLRCFRKIF